MDDAVDKSCPCDEDEGKLTCTVCKNIKYCSKECQEADWSSHKLLCKTFKNFKTRPHPNMRRVIVFPPNEKEPSFEWCQIKQGCGYQTVEFEDFMGTRTSKSQNVKRHAFSQKPLKHTLGIRFDDDFMYKYDKENEGITNATGDRLTLRWRGPVLIVCGNSLPDHMPDNKDIIRVRDADTRTLADVVAYFIDYYNSTPENAARKATRKVVAVRSNCTGEQNQNEAASFVEVHVPTLHQIFDKMAALSLISVRVGMPLLTRKYTGKRKVKGLETSYFTNQAITSMHSMPNPKAGFGFASPLWQGSVGNVLIVRKDRKPLTVNIAGAFAAYCQHHLQQHFRWQAELEAEFGDGSYKQIAVREITPEKWATYLRQWRREKKRRAHHRYKKSDNVGDVMLPVDRMALTARYGMKLGNRLFKHTDIEGHECSLSEESDELVGASRDGEPDELGPDPTNDSDDDDDLEVQR